MLSGTIESCFWVCGTSVEFDACSVDIARL